MYPLRILNCFMNDRRDKPGIRGVLCITLILAAGNVYATGDNRESTYDEGIPAVLMYAEKYQREKPPFWRTEKAGGSLLNAVGHG